MSPSPAAEDLIDRLGALADVLEDALVRHAPDRSAPWAARSLEALDRIGRAARTDRPEEQLPLIDDALVELRAARRGAGAPATPATPVTPATPGDAPTPGPDGLVALLDEVVAFAVEVRARALDVAPHAPGSTAAAPPTGAVRASLKTPGVQHGIELPPPDLLPRETAFDPAADTRSALAAAGGGTKTVRLWLAEDEEAQQPPGRPAVSLPAARGTPLEVAQLERIGRDCLEDIAVLGGLRRPEGELAWSFAERFDDRLLANLDALLALDRPRTPAGPRLGVARALWAYLQEWSVPDPGRAFAFAFVLACSAEESGPRWVAVTMRRAHPRLARAFEDAFALGSSPHIPAVLAATLDGESDPARLRIALRGWRRHGRIDPVAVTPLTVHPDLELAQEAIAALGDAPGELATTPLRELLSGEPTSAAAAAVALARRGHREGLQHLRAVLAAPDDTGALDAARSLAADAVALLGDPRDAAMLASFCALHPARAELLGWHGQPAHVGALLEGLAADTDEARCAAAWGLTRVLGVPGRASSVRGTTGPLRDPAAWREHVARTPLEPGKRHQIARLAPGGAGTSARLGDELLADTTLQRDRPRLKLELELHLARPLPVDLEGWTARQRGILDAARAL